jgi:hypothetical protein
MKVSLDLFHAVQHISSKLSKRHSFHRPCLHDLSMVFRYPSDQGLVRTMVTSSTHVLIENLKKFTKKWKDIHYCGQLVLTPNVVKELNAIPALKLCTKGQQVWSRDGKCAYYSNII